MLYSQLIDKLFSVNLHGGMKLGLSNMLKLHELLKKPAEQFKSIHVAGTNGKGSVSTKIAKALEVDGHRVGLFTSPHIASFRERIQINGELIEKEKVIELLELIFSLIEENHIQATFFEITTALALKYFADKSVDFVVLETGLGGRLDATNIITPILSIITSISLEHTEILGTTIEEITYEKAGIIKQNIPILIGPSVRKDLIQKIANDKQSPLFAIHEPLPIYTEENNAIAKSALQLLKIKENSIEKGLKALPPCRFEQVSSDPLIILDVGHNPNGLNCLLDALKEKYPDKVYRTVFGLSKSKDIDGCLDVLKQFGSDFHLVEAPNGRGISLDQLEKSLLKRSFSSSSIHIEESIAKTIDVAVKLAKKNQEVLVICGTFFIMSEIRLHLGINEYRDDIDMNERFIKKDSL